jgi:8-oxo-dGTP pyrophosphatase MutT (NUDIX family)
VTATLTALHRDATETLTRWNPPDPEQAELRRYYLRHLASYDDGLSRDRLPEHLTASALVISHDAEQVLLNLHGKVGRWLQFGGHCEHGDLTLAGAAARETVEESGIPAVALDPVPVQLSRHEVRCGGGPSYHLDVQFLAIAPRGAVPHCSDESDEVRWFAVDDLPAGTDRVVLDLVQRAVARHFTR